MVHGQNEFADRIERLDTLHFARVEARPVNSTRWDWVANLGYPGSIAGSFMLGVLAVVLARLVTYYTTGAPEEDINLNLMLLGDSVLTAVIAIILRSSFFITDRICLTAKAVGIWIALTCMHNFVHAMPGFWGLIFSREWVVRTMDVLEPGTIFLGNFSIILVGQ